MNVSDFIALQEHWNAAARVIQTTWRRYSVYRPYNVYKGAICSVQRRRRSLADFRWRKRVVSVISTIQAIWRGNRVRRLNVRARVFSRLRRSESQLRRLGALYECPITMEVPRDPVFNTSDGCVYDRDSITTWVRRNNSSPHNRFYTSLDSLYRFRSNRTIEWEEEHQDENPFSSEAASDDEERNSPQSDFQGLVSATNQLLLAQVLTPSTSNNGTSSNSDENMTVLPRDGLGFRDFMDFLDFLERVRPPNSSEVSRASLVNTTPEVNAPHTPPHRVRPSDAPPRLFRRRVIPPHRHDSPT